MKQAKTRKRPKTKSTSRPLSPKQRKALNLCIGNFLSNVADCVKYHPQIPVHACQDIASEKYKDCKEDAGIPREAYPPPKIVFKAGLLKAIRRRAKKKGK
jgi:hypothetical protein